MKTSTGTLQQRQSDAGMTQMQENGGMQKVLARQLKARPPANVPNWTDKCLRFVRSSVIYDKHNCAVWWNSFIPPRRLLLAWITASTCAPADCTCLSNMWNTDSKQSQWIHFFAACAVSQRVTASLWNHTEKNTGWPKKKMSFAIFEPIWWRLDQSKSKQVKECKANKTRATSCLQ